MNILIAGIGNIFEGDDAFGCEVAKSLSSRAFPPDVRVVDFGIRGLDLTYALLDNPDMTILLDATPRGGDPGTVYTIEPELHDLETEEAVFETHAMNPVRVLRAVRAMGGRLERVLLVGCEPGDLGGEEGRMGLTPPVAAAVEKAADVVENLIKKELLEVEHA